MNPEDRTRRGFLSVILMTPVAFAVSSCARAAEGADGDRKAPAKVVIENFSPAGKSLGKKSVPRVVKADEEWKTLLPEGSYYVTRHDGTERPYSGKYNDHHADGVYRCICCDTALFDSRTKYESGTGWPSFWKPISNANVRERPDNSQLITRTEVACTRCDAHLGHVFDDGPDPTGLRYCMNSVALNFKPRA